MTLKQFFPLCVFFFCCVYCDKNDSRSCFLHKTKLNYDLVDAEKLRVFDVTEKDISYGYGMAEVAGRIGVGAGVSAATLGMGCAAAQTSNVMRATVATVDTLEGLGAGVGLVKGGADMAENGVNSNNLAQVGSSLLTFIGLGNKACFTAGTQVVVGEVYDEELCTTTYVTANIEDIKVGDYVLTQDVETGEVSLKEVTDTFIRTSDHLRYLTTVDEEGDIQTIETTDAHPLWVVTDNPDLSRAASDVVIENGTVLYHENLGVTENGYWIEAKDLRIGDVFIGANGELTTLTATERVEYPNGITVYNFSVEGNHNYYVIANFEAYPNGASVVLVHNAVGYRAVSHEEADDIIKNGFRSVANSMPGKWFATTYEGAVGFMTSRMSTWAKPPKQIIKAEVPDEFILGPTKKHDGIADSFYVSEEYLDKIILRPIQ